MPPSSTLYPHASAHPATPLHPIHYLPHRRSACHPATPLHPIHYYHTGVPPVTQQHPFIPHTTTTRCSTCHPATPLHPIHYYHTGAPPVTRQHPFIPYTITTQVSHLSPSNTPSSHTPLPYRCSICHPATPIYSIYYYHIGVPPVTQQLPFIPCTTIQVLCLSPSNTPTSAPHGSLYHQATLLNPHVHALPVTQQLCNPPHHAGAPHDNPQHPPGCHPLQLREIMGQRYATHMDQSCRVSQCNWTLTFQGLTLAEDQDSFS